ncbi:MAG: 50S ribosomal protein L19e [Candidatus Woesearchaeota archaeon]
MQKRLASQLLKCSPKRVWLDPAKMSEIKEAITKADVRRLISIGAIAEKAAKHTSRWHARVIKAQKSKGRRKGKGSRQGSHGARASPKKVWAAVVRLQREFVKRLHAKAIIPTKVYHELYAKIKGGFFRSKRHIGLYLKERGLIK